MNLIFDNVGGYCLSLWTMLFPYFSKFFFLLIIFSALYAFFLFLKTFFFRRKLVIMHKSSRLKSLENKYALHDSLFLISSPKPLAFSSGIIKPKIYISTGLLKILNTKELEAVLLHEKQHIKQYDTLLIYLFSFLRNIFLFLPIFHDILDFISIKREIQADRLAIRYVGVAPLTSAFQKLLSFRNKPRFLSNTLIMFFKMNTLEHRVYALSHTKSFSISFKLKHVAVSIFTIFLLLFALVPLHTTHAHENISDKSICLPSHSCYYSCTSER